MADGTHIEWTDATWNVVNGCTLKSPGCEHCYAMRLAATRLQNHPSRAGLARMHNGHPQWTGEVRFNDKVLLDPLRWRRPRKIFVCAHGDLFHEKVPDEWIDKVFAVMALAPQHVFQVLTKRPERMRTYMLEQRHGRPAPHVAQAALRIWKEDLHGLSGSGYLAIPGSEFDTPNLICWALPNVWLGVSVEDQQRADERIPILLDTPAAVRWLSCEPLLGSVDLTKLRVPHEYLPTTATRDDCWGVEPLSGRLAPVLECGGGEWSLDGGGQRAGRIDWVVAGGESGPGARPMHPDWARSLRDQCAAAGVPFLFKQWGDWLPVAGWPTLGDPLGFVPKSRELHLFECGSTADRVGKKAAGRLLDGVQHDGYPERTSNG